MPLTVSVTGHRPHRLTGKPGPIGANCLRGLKAIRNARPEGENPVALTALAEGADRIFAIAALEAGFDLNVMLPYPEEDYLKSFVQPDDPVYARLRSGATIVETLPGQLGKANDAYLALGETLVARGDIMFAIWDGKPAAGKGGTTDVLNMARAAGKPVVWIAADGSDLLRIIVNKRIAEIEPDELHRFI